MLDQRRIKKSSFPNPDWKDLSNQAQAQTTVQPRIQKIRFPKLLEIERMDKILSTISQLTIKHVISRIKGFQNNILA